jgi:hypothetical protein
MAFRINVARVALSFVIVTATRPVYPGTLDDLTNIGRFVGQTVWVLNTQGVEVAGTVISVTSTELVVSESGTRRVILGKEITRVVQKGDPVWDGALIGAIVGVAATQLPLEGPSCTVRCFSDTAAGKALGVGIIAAIGALWDHKRQRVKVIYQVP